MEEFWDILWTTFIIFAFVAYLMILVSILTDLFRDRSLNGWLKAVWIIFLVWVPFFTALVYLIGRGKGMAERQHAYAEQTRQATNDYIRQTAGSGPSSEIAQAKALLDSEAITAEEYEHLKAKAMASSSR
ncbi:MAG TPA: hypothetical protein VGP24_04395 [Glaciihabitans sp.]|jgi:hypothetical protein|nr:hypothetical protein [Glaciihabitans sp.]